ncbi:hypothetical protein GOBAR_DD20185 [Gossypium barbadense]|nr:hypothetical protein GOBAR_DD20185 [Gossypium barbadense]
MVQGLIDTGILRFDGFSNVVGNPLPNHTDGNVNAVKNEDEWQTKSCVAEIRTPLWKEFRKLLQDMMDNKEVKIFDRMEEAEEREIYISNNQSLAIPYSVDRPLVIYYEAKKEEVKPKVVIEVSSPFPYTDNKAVPWKYNVNIVVPEGNKIPAPKLSRNTKMGIKLTVGKGVREKKCLGRYQQGIAKALKLVHHKVRYDLEFEPDICERRKLLQKNQERRIARVSGQELE